GAVLPRMGKEQARAQAKEREDEQRRLAFQEQLLEAEGKTFDAAILKIREEAEEYRRAGATAAEVNQFVEQKTAQAKFEAAAGSTQHAMKSFDVQKRGIELQGGKSGEAARTREVNALLSKQLPLLEEKADLEMQAALASGNLDDIARAQQDEQAVKNLKVQTKSLADQVKGPLQGAFTDFFSNLGKQGETARQSFAQLGASISEAFQRAFSQKLVAEVTGGGKSAGTSSSGGWGAGLSQLSSLMSLFHGGRSGSSSGGESSDTLAAMGSFGMSLGGHVRGAGTGTSDSIPAMLSHGEYVLNARATSAIGHENLDKINFSRHFAAGGYASVADFARPALHFAEGGMVPAPGEGGGSIDMHVGLDEGLVLRHLSSKGAGRVLLNHVATNPKAFHHALSRGR
ncbi:MAG: hypothetical protein ACRD3Y_09600, partial [Bryobacteraceae bacterium]